MQKIHAQLLVGLSILLLLLVSIDLFAIKDKNKEPNISQQKSNLVDKVNKVGKVLSGCGACWEMFIKDSSTSAYITDARAELITHDAFSVCYSDATTTSWVFGVGYFAPNEYGLDCNLQTGTNPDQVTVSITKSGYQSKTTSIPYRNPDYSIPTVLLTSAQEANSVTSSSSNLTKKTTTTTSTVETIKNVNLPIEFATGGSTNLAAIVDPAKVESLTLDTSVGTIKFNETVDLSATETKDKFKELDKYVKIEQEGVISIDSTNLPVLNKKATLTMKGLGFVKTPRVLYNGKEDKSVVSNIKYKNGVLTFDVTKFSTFTAAPTVGINEPANNFETTEKTVTLKGTVSDPTATVSAKLNNKDLGKLKVSTGGAFEKEVVLEEGDNNLVVTALSNTLATASASVSGVLKSANLTLIYALLGFLVVIGLGGLVYTIKKMHKSSTTQPQPKPTV